MSASTSKGKGKGKAVFVEEEHVHGPQCGDSHSHGHGHGQEDEEYDDFDGGSGSDGLQDPVVKAADIESAMETRQHFMDGEVQRVQACMSDMGEFDECGDRERGRAARCLRAGVRLPVPLPSPSPSPFPSVRELTLQRA